LLEEELDENANSNKEDRDLPEEKTTSFKSLDRDLDVLQEDKEQLRADKEPESKLSKLSDQRTSPPVPPAPGCACSFPFFASWS